MTEPMADQPSSTTGTRWRRRLAVVSPIEATWRDADGRIFREPGRATEVNSRGGLLQMKIHPIVGSQIELKNLLSQQSSHARVVGIRRNREGQLLGVAVELLVPSDTFWGVNFQLRRTCTDLVTLEHEIRPGGIDPNILREFRDAVDNVRKTAWAVQEWQERQLREQDPNTLLPLLIAERIRRATQLCNAIISDAAAHEIVWETVGIEELCQTVECLRDGLRNLFRDEK